LQRDGPPSRSVLQHNTAHCNKRQHTTTILLQHHCNNKEKPLQHYCNTSTTPLQQQYNTTATKLQLQYLPFSCKGFSLDLPFGRCIATHCNTRQHITSTLLPFDKCVATHCNTLQQHCNKTATARLALRRYRRLFPWPSISQSTTTHGNARQHTTTTTHGNTLQQQSTATHYNNNARQHTTTTTHGNTLQQQRTATH